jgi:allophanate hydrolase subunit 1
VIRQAPSCEPRILPVGDCALTVEFGRAIDPQTHAMVLDFVRALESIAGTGHLAGVVEWAAAFCPATVCFDPGQIVSESLAEILLTLATKGTTASVTGLRCRIPACFQRDFAGDLEELARTKKLDPEAMIALMAHAVYCV